MHNPVDQYQALGDSSDLENRLMAISASRIELSPLPSIWTQLHGQPRDMYLRQGIDADAVNIWLGIDLSPNSKECRDSSSLCPNLLGMRNTVHIIYICGCVLSEGPVFCSVEGKPTGKRPFWGAPQKQIHIGVLQTPGRSSSVAKLVANLINGDPRLIYRPIIRGVVPPKVMN